MDTYAIIGLGNPGKVYAKNRHNIGFMVVELFGEIHGASWKTSPEYAMAEVSYNDKKVILIKPLTGMNNSGIVQALLKKRNISINNTIVVHDELEIPFGKLTIKQSGSARGHNGLRSIIASSGADFYRLRFGISRPDKREEVPDYVLSNFTEPSTQVHELTELAVKKLEEFIVNKG